ncbi:hypothetical protein I4U23_022589 [Adineta vaga]|nr:hypothetical protein I4U23_022589 [Adineta vaga]
MYVTSDVNKKFFNTTCDECTCTALTTGADGWNCLTFNQTCQLINNYTSSDSQFKIVINGSFLYRNSPLTSSTPSISTTISTSTTTTTIQTQLQTLFNQAPYLYSLKITYKEQNIPEIALFGTLSLSIRCLDLQQYNKHRDWYWLNSQQCEMLRNQSNDTYIVSNLDSTATEYVLLQFLRDFLDSSCTVTRNIRNSDEIHL